MVRLRRCRETGVDLHGHAASEKVDGQDEERPPRDGIGEETLYAGEGPAADAHAAAVADVEVGTRQQERVENAADRVDLMAGDESEHVAGAQQAEPGPALVCVPEKEMSGEQ